MSDIVDEMDFQADMDRAAEIAKLVGTYWQNMRQACIPDDLIVVMAIQFQGALLFDVTVIGENEADDDLEFGA